MKKFLFTLVTILVSIYAWAAVTKTTLNPYAYDLKTEYWNNETQQLVVSFKLNAAPNKDVSANNNKRGIQIYAYEPSNPSVKYCIYQVPGNVITDNTNLQYTCTIPMDGMSKENEVELRRRLPEGKDLTWEVRVQGVNRANVGTPQVVIDDISHRPYSCHGIAVQNCQDAPDFGYIYVTEASNGAPGGVWQWITNAKGRSLLKYNPTLSGEPTAYKKSSDFSLRGQGMLEPHRVRISDDGRIFVSSYNKNTDANKKQIDVWEFENKNGIHTFNPIIYHNYTLNGVYGDRVCGMDVKGEGKNLKLLLCFLDEYDNNYANSFQAYEYNIGSLESGATTNSGSRKWRYRPVGKTSSVAAGAEGTPNGVIERARKDHWYFYMDGFTNISYGAKNKNDILFAVDYFQGSWFNSNVMYFKDGAYTVGGDVTPKFQVAEDPNGTQNKENHYYGGAGMLPYLDGNTEYVISGRAKYHGYEKDPNNPTLNKEEEGRIHMYQLGSDNVSSTARDSYSVDVKTRAVVNDIAMDRAHNIYAVSFTDGTNECGSGRIVAVALPYDGETVTAAPKSEQKFQFNPVKLSEDEDVSTISDKLQGQDCSVYLNRPMQADMFNTICLPFDLDVKNLATNHPYYNATVLAFDGVTISTSNNESILELNFVSTDGVIYKNTPYLIQPQNDIPDKVSFDNVKLDPYTDFSDIRYQVPIDNITFWGIIPQSIISATDPENEVVLILVADNRLANVTKKGTYRGFRGFFYFDRRNVPANVGARIAERKPTPTSVINLNGEQVDVEKFLREGRVYIRMGEELYTINGEKVE